MKRNIIVVDEGKCNGCGKCIVNCPEGALAIVNGKARVIRESSCDGLGACIGHCPQNAIKIEVKDVPAYDERSVVEEISSKGEAAIMDHLRHLRDHGEEEYLKTAISYLKEKNINVPELSPAQKKGQESGGCPGMKQLFRQEERSVPADGSGSGSQLRQWPVQLKLLNPEAPYFKSAELLFAADCVPFSYAGFHQRFLAGKTLIIFCPKLDESSEEYISKISEVIKKNSIKSISIVRMEVPCCSGMTAIVEEAIKRSGVSIVIKEYVISLEGQLT